MKRLIETYQLGRDYRGWKCKTCKKEYIQCCREDARSTYIRLVLHLLIKHHRLPQPTIYKFVALTTWRNSIG